MSRAGISLELREDDDVAEEEEVSLPRFGALRHVHTIVQQQLSVLTGEAVDEGTVLH